MTNFLKPLILLFFILQLWIASSFELAHDEAYYWIFSKYLDWGYFDHPPGVALIIRLFSFIPRSELGVRIGFVILQFGSLYSLLKITDRSNHLRATLLFLTFPLASLTGLFALPDMPLLFMSGIYCYVLKDFLESKTTLNSILLGVVIALLLYAKYHGILLVCFTVLALPNLFKEKKFYIVAIVALLCFLPHMIWQYGHEFATLRYHFFERPSSGFNMKRLIEYLAIQIFSPGLLVGPLVWLAVLKNKKNDSFSRSLKYICIGTVAFFFISTISKKFEANWTIFLTIPLIYLGVDSDLWKKRIFKILLDASFLIVLIVRFVFLFSPKEISLKRLNEFNGWEAWAQEVRLKCRPYDIVANTYQVASKLSFYLDEEIHALNYHSRKNQFDFWRLDLKKPIKQVCYISSSREFGGEAFLTPEGKKLWLVKNMSYDGLLAKKADAENYK
jgi:4-amino-4-deoxy-L-arabinose transferase-like glycosyltransferase